jgi:hypothetical protein
MPYFAATKTEALTRGMAGLRPIPVVQLIEI